MIALLTRDDDLDRYRVGRVLDIFPRSFLYTGLAPPKSETSDHGSAARKELEEQNYYRDDQQQVDQSTTNSTDQAQ